MAAIDNSVRETNIWAYYNLAKYYYLNGNLDTNTLKDIENEKESVFNHLNMKYHDYIIDEVINKYHLEPSNYIVDLLYEALIYESNNRK